jgi:hypothetical protein
MRTVLASSDPVALSLAMSLLRDAGFEPVEFDRHMSGLGAFPSRVMVPAEDEAAARRLLQQAGLT